MGDEIKICSYKQSRENLLSQIHTTGNIKESSSSCRNIIPNVKIDLPEEMNSIINDDC